MGGEDELVHTDHDHDGNGPKHKAGGDFRDDGAENQCQPRAALMGAETPESRAQSTPRELGRRKVDRHGDA